MVVNGTVGRVAWLLTERLDRSATSQDLYLDIPPQKKSRLIAIVSSALPKMCVSGRIGTELDCHLVPFPVACSVRRR